EYAFAAAVRRHRPELQRHCARLLRSPADAEDALQETLLRAWRSRRTLTSGAPRAWLYRIATNACLDLAARREPTCELPDDHEPAAPSEQRPDAQLLARETLELALLTAIQQLPPRQHASLMLRDVLDCSARDTASALSTSVAASNSALQRCRDGLRERLAGDRHDWACQPPSAAQRSALRSYLRALEVAHS
ncbi:MAG: sigma-70 family RNA polymerase sigma factor, partial [Thermoleophilia bacterium]|nr:sigma-70 family RNA polymerase sigma factor [Thermoleophilia bacterium]